jgi:outer membrane lipoprotein-sorting protein
MRDLTTKAQRHKVMLKKRAPGFRPKKSSCLRAFVVFFLPIFLANTSFSQPSGEQILKNIEANYAGIEDYTVALDVAVDLERMKVPKMQATMFYKKPDKVTFKSEGFALLPKEGVGITPGSLSSRFDVQNVEEKKNAERYVLTMTMKSDKTKLRKAFVVVNSANWTVASISTPQSDDRQMNAAFDYQRVAGHWLPVMLNVVFTSDTTTKEAGDPFGQITGAVRTSQIPRKGSISVRYSDYRLNTGLKDEVFEQEDHLKK